MSAEYTELEHMREDFEYRFKNYLIIKNWLLGMKGRVSERRDLLGENLRYNKQDEEAGHLRSVLSKVGWMPLDPYYVYKEEEKNKWLSAKINLSDDNINLAMRRYMQPWNRSWCYCLTEDFSNFYD